MIHTSVHILRDEGISPLGFESVDISIALGPRDSPDLRLWVRDCWAPTW